MTDIITCPQWGARPPRIEPTWTSGPAQRIIIHHTAGHHPEISVPNEESRDEAILYARRIQDFHMNTNGWIDSGHNFLVCRNGLILQGRWRTVRSIQAGRMVVSAHCPGQNEQIGIEHEHLGTELMTEEQREASADLIAWISVQYHLDKALPMFPHNKFFATSCPVNLVSEIPNLRRMANAILAA